jgi:hypothetical protein
VQLLLLPVLALPLPVLVPELVLRLLVLVRELVPEGCNNFAFQHNHSALLKQLLTQQLKSFYSFRILCKN